MFALNGWADDLMDELKDAFNAKLASWQDGLYALDVERSRLIDLERYAARTPADAEEWETQRSRIDLFSDTVQAVGNAIGSIRSYTADLGASANLAGIPTMGILPAIPAAALAILTGGVVALGALIYSVKSFNDRIVATHYADINKDLVEQGKSPLTLPSGSDAIGNIAQVVQWGVIGIVAMMLFKQMGQRE